jgi:hypothetical protein
MLEEIEVLKSKTEMNREQVEQAKADADAAIGATADAEKVRCLHLITITHLPLWCDVVIV